MKTIILDPGHGAGKASNRGGLLFNEGDQNYKFCKLFKKTLEKKGFKVYITRDDITDDPSLKERGRMYKGDLFISWHSNAGPSTARGAEIFQSVQNSNETLSKRLVNAISSVLKIPNRGVKRRYDGNHDWYGVLYFSDKSALRLIIETAFHTNRADSISYLDNQEALAEKLSNVIYNYFYSDGYKWKRDKKGWWLKYSDGTYPKDSWRHLDGIWYYFKHSGYACCNEWEKINDKWYWFDSNCMMYSKRWLYWNYRWYYLKEDGSMMKDSWIYYKDKWYYLGWDGAMYTDAKTPDGFYVNDKGEWVK